MSNTKEKHNRLKGVDFSPQSASLMFPSDLLDSGQDRQCMTFFINTIKNGKAKMQFNGGPVTPKNNLKSAYGEVPVIHVVSTGIAKQSNNVSKNSQIFSNTFIRSDQSITLPMPKELRFHTRSNWSKVELGQTGMVIDQAADFKELNQNGLGLAGQMAGSTIGSIAEKFKIPGKSLFELGTATVANNYAETLFKNVDHRSFSWSWNLTPRNAKEAETIDNLIRLFKFHMLPEKREDLGNGNAYLSYPSSFDIVFWSEGEPNKYIPRIATCALVDMDTNYTPNGSYIVTSSDSPQSYNLTLTFNELSMMHKGLVGTDLGTGDGSASGTTF